MKLITGQISGPDGALGLHKEVYQTRLVAKWRTWRGRMVTFGSQGDFDMKARYFVLSFILMLLILGCAEVQTTQKPESGGWGGST